MGPGSATSSPVMDSPDQYTRGTYAPRTPRTPALPTRVDAPHSPHSRPGLTLGLTLPPALTTRAHDPG